MGYNQRRKNNIISYKASKRKAVEKKIEYKYNIYNI